MDPREHRDQLERRSHPRSSSSGVRARTVQLLELTAAASPELLHFAIELGWSSPLRLELLDLAREWGLRRQELPAALIKASDDLNRLTRLRAAWRRLDQVVASEPNLAVIRALALARHQRIGRPKLSLLRKLEQVEDHERARSRILDWLSQPGLSDIDFESYGL